MSEDHMQRRLLDPSIRIEPFEQAAVTAEDVLTLWAREGAVTGEEAARRVGEVLVVATQAQSGQLVGVSTAVIRHSDRFGTDMWYMRAFVSEAARIHNAAAHLVDAGRRLLEERFVHGTDLRAPGVWMDIQNEGLKQRMTDAVWDTVRFVFVGVNQRGDHVRVRYFPGATIPVG